MRDVRPSPLVVILTGSRNCSVSNTLSICCRRKSDTLVPFLAHHPLNAAKLYSSISSDVRIFILYHLPSGGVYRYILAHCLSMIVCLLYIERELQQSCNSLLLWETIQFVANYHCCLLLYLQSSNISLYMGGFFYLPQYFLPILTINDESWVCIECSRHVSPV